MIGMVTSAILSLKKKIVGDTVITISPGEYYPPGKSARLPIFIDKCF